MKILILVNRGYKGAVGGAEIFASNLCEALKVTDEAVLLDDMRGRVQNKVLRKMFFDYNNPLGEAAILKQIHDIDPDVVHINNMYGMAVSIIKKIAEAYPVVLTAHDTSIISYSGRMPKIINRLHADTIRKALENTSIVTQSDYIRRQLIATGYKNVTLIRNGVKIPLKGSKLGKNILIVGRLSKEKGVQTVVTTLNSVNGFKTMVLGKGDMRKTLEANYKNVSFLGFKAPSGYYEKSSILVFPSICEENQPLSVIEAMSYGMCVIASKTGGVPELIRHKRTGMLFEPGNETDFERQLRYVIDDTKKLADIGRSARMFIKKKFLWENTVKAYRRAYKKAVFDFIKRQKAGANA